MKRSLSLPLASILLVIAGLCSPPPGAEAPARPGSRSPVPEACRILPRGASGRLVTAPRGASGGLAAFVPVQLTEATAASPLAGPTGRREDTPIDAVAEARRMAALAARPELGTAHGAMSASRGK